MLSSVSIQINKDLYEHTKQDAILEHRTDEGQIEYWAEVGRAAIDNAVTNESGMLNKLGDLLD
jgi:hypothetical protein